MWHITIANRGSITGGVFYRGRRFPELCDVYFYGDYATGKIWGLRHQDGKATWQKELANTRLQIVGFGLDPTGELLIVDLGGQVHRVERAPAPKADQAWPRKLSETGLFLSTAEHRPQPGSCPTRSTRHSGPTERSRSVLSHCRATRR